ncbi:MAG: MFS transporter [Actinomycetota bacterium]|nr:MFS transporter [Actinomycetota bacterium]
MRVDRAILLAAGAGAFGSLDTALNIAFPDLVDGFGIEVGQLQWVVVSFVLTYGGLLLAAGQLGDRLGHQRMMTLGAAGSIVAMTACALAPTFPLFIAARVFQGVTTAAVMAAGPALASLAAGETSRGRAIGVFQLSAGIGGAIGPLLGGPLVSLGGWPAVFWFRVPVSMALLLLARSVVQGAAASPDGPASNPTDVRGAVLTALTLAGGLLVVNSGRELGWSSALLWLAVILTTAVGGAYVSHARRVERPIIDLRLFRDLRFAAANLLNLVSNATMFVAWLLLPTLLIDHIGLTTFSGGVVLAMAPGAMALASPFAGRWSDASGPEAPVIAGLAVETAGLALLASLDEGSSPIAAALAMAIIGVGLGLFAAPNMALVMSALPEDRQGVASGLALLTRTTGIVVGVAGTSAVFDSLEADRGFVGAFAPTAWASTGVTGAALLLAIVVALTTQRSASRL